MPADMCTKPCSGPIISRSIKWMTEFRFIQSVRHNTINSWDYISSLWNKWIIDRIYRSNSRFDLNKVGASLVKRKYHRRYYINILVSGYLLFNWQERLAINKAGSWSMERKCYRHILSIFQITIPQISQISWTWT